MFFHCLDFLLTYIWLNTKSKIMKNVSIFIALTLLNVGFSQTNISSFYVSGTWTLSGSPYLIQNDITILSSQTLLIESGVEVRFQPESSLMVNGQLIADGVTFESIDTNGFSNQLSTSGGWNGIHFMPFSGNDQSVFNNCIVRDCKYGYSYTVLYSNAFTCCRELNITNCLFENNHSGVGTYISDMMIYLAPQYTGDTIIFDKCIVRDNYSTFGAIRNSNYYGGYTSITNSSIHNNDVGSGIWGVQNNLLIENNEIFENNSTGDNCPIKLSIGNVVVRGNKIHHNECEQLAAVGCRSGNIIVENNLICNNFQTDGDCGMLAGGGGINLSHNEGAADFLDTYYLVRNNVIANNNSAYGGGGIYVYNSRATISNNHIVNNYTPSNGNAILISSPLSEVYMKNNLFFGKSSSGMADSVGIIHVISVLNLEFDYNYSPSDFNVAVTSESSFNVIGSVTNNFIGSDPEMVSPTSSNELTENAIYSDFNISPLSDCVDNGDSTNCSYSQVDFLSNNRFVNTIDIGAFEYLHDASLDPFISEEQLSISVFPNPIISGGILSVTTVDEYGLITIFDGTGKMVLSTSTTSAVTQISLNDFVSGYYLLRFEGIDGDHATTKIIVTN